MHFLYGYDIVKDSISINPEQAAVVRQIFADYIGGEGGTLIARKLNERGIPAPQGGLWNPGRIAGIIQNEKFTGNSLLQKKFTADHLTKKQVRNIGQLPQYYAEGTHTAIIDMATFEQAKAVREQRRQHFKCEDTSQNRYPFTGKIICEQCGKHYKRKKAVGCFHWQCASFLQDGKAACAAKQIPEETLYEVCKEFNLDDIAEIRVPGNNRLVLVFYDGRRSERTWQDRSRRESWTEEMRQTARERVQKQHAERREAQ
ncbi:MAG: recombinase family protein [Oscillospiraceae bacterium]|nr:recombinase family protein [Oscillospiraceae bacterium]